MTMPLADYPSVHYFYEALGRQFPYFSAIIPRQVDAFGDEWLKLFDAELKAFFGGDHERIDRGVRGYGKFALDSMKLQVKFQKTKEYDNKTYAQAASEVYQNKDYMFGLYLPGILLSHYLWRHHFLQHIFFRDRFLPLVGSGEGKTFNDIGVGTGFYSKEMLARTKVTGNGYDLSPHALAHAELLLAAQGIQGRYRINLRDVTTEPAPPAADYLINIEVLEHLEDPQTFLNALAKMLKPGGYGLFSAAVNAPNADHIYLYREPAEVAAQLTKAGFEIVDAASDVAYFPRTETELVPVNAAFIVTKK